jgi:hypothetical protein
MRRRGLRRLGWRGRVAMFAPAPPQILAAIVIFCDRARSVRGNCFSQEKRVVGAMVANVCCLAVDNEVETMKWG